MLLFLDLAHDDAKQRGLFNTTGDLREAIVHGAVKRSAAWWGSEASDCGR